MRHNDIPKKANHILHIFFLSLLLIGIRIFHLATVQHDAHVELARKPMRRKIVEKAARGVILDRFGEPLAVNKIQYNVSICYDQIREIPRVKWGKDENGVRKKIFARKDYISKLSLFLGTKFSLDPTWIEDVIYSKSSIFPKTPFVIKHAISERSYYELRMLEKTYPGMLAERCPTRAYPQGKLAGDLIGYLGSINQEEYFAIAKELSSLTEFLQSKDRGLPTPLPHGFRSSQEVKKRLQELEEKAYRINDFVGKTGLEKQFDENLRGIYGTKKMELGAKGRFIRTLPESTCPVPGKEFTLSIAKGLQEHAEKLLTISEMDREKGFAFAGKNHSTITPPWIKGGSVVAMIPKTGEIVAMASYPRFDPNDFIGSGDDKTKQEKSFSVTKWLENENYIAKIWDGVSDLERECFSEKTDSYYSESERLTWDTYLNYILSQKGSIHKGLRQLDTIGKMMILEQVFEMLLKLSLQEDMTAVIDALYPKNAKHPLNGSLAKELKRIAIQEAFTKHETHVQMLKKEADLYLLDVLHNDDKLLLLDLCRIAVSKNLFSDALFAKVKHHNPAFYRELSQAKAVVECHVKEEARTLFHTVNFTLWRKEHFKEYLSQKRILEKEKKTYARPYLDYLEEAEKKLFADFWQKHRWDCLRAFLSLDANFCKEASLKPMLFHLIRCRQILKKEGNKKLVSCTHLLATQLKELSSDVGTAYLQTMRSFEELKHPLWGHYSHVRSIQGIQYQKHLAAAYYPASRWG
ncbi:MAG: hypothetical protein KAR79_05025, partial [Simkaniaceae bacterium]|nr:hypothetical protein [Simkaniaceae bacterium]